MPDDIILRDMKAKTNEMEGIVRWLERLYYNQSVVDIFHKPALSMIITGAKFLHDNMKYLRDEYAKKQD